MSEVNTAEDMGSVFLLLKRLPAPRNHLCGLNTGEAFEAKYINITELVVLEESN